MSSGPLDAPASPPSGFTIPALEPAVPAARPVAHPAQAFQAQKEAGRTGVLRRNHAPRQLCFDFANRTVPPDKA